MGDKMNCVINDRSLIAEIISFKTLIEENVTNIKSDYKAKDKTIERFEYPLNDSILHILTEIQPSSKKDGVIENNITYDNIDQIEKLWVLLLDKSIKCLRFFDEREPFLENQSKKPFSYGLDKLSDYQRKYAEFEGMLYGSSPYYRDHIFHSVRTWMLGIFCLLNKKVITGEILINLLEIDGENPENSKTFSKEMNVFEKISMWTIIALTHDLGYPLEKSQQIFDKTRNMMEVFVANPRVWTDIAFNGIQDSINDYIVRFMSSKMKKAGDEYKGQIQPKYYLKYKKSLERYDHGIISSIILYKMLLYFIESDINLNDDYKFKGEDVKQFYVRREILRAIASHTSKDIYNIKVSTFSCLLMICDELQEWGRKSWKNLYVGTMPNATTLTIKNFNTNRIDIYEKIDMKFSDEKTVIDNINRIIKKQYENYKMIFRDGQYTNLREFSFIKTLLLLLEEDGTTHRCIKISYEINCKEKDKFIIDITSACPSVGMDKCKTKGEETCEDTCNQSEMKKSLNDILTKLREKYENDIIKFDKVTVEVI